MEVGGGKRCGVPEAAADDRLRLNGSETLERPAYIQMIDCLMYVVTSEMSLHLTLYSFSKKKQDTDFRQTPDSLLVTSKFPIHHKAKNPA